MNQEEMLQYGIVPSDATSVHQSPVYRNAPSTQYIDNPNPYNQAYSEDIPISNLDETNAWRTLAGAQPLRSTPEILQEQFDRATTPGAELAKETGAQGLARLALTYGDLALPLAGALSPFYKKASQEATTMLSNLSGMHPWQANAAVRDAILEPEKTWLSKQVLAAKLPAEQARVARSVRILESDPTKKLVRLPNMNRKGPTVTNLYHTHVDKQRLLKNKNFVPSTPEAVYGDIDNEVARRVVAGAEKEFIHPKHEFMNRQGSDLIKGSEGLIGDGAHRAETAAESGTPLRKKAIKYYQEDGKDVVEFPPQKNYAGAKVSGESVSSMLRDRPTSVRTYLKTTEGELSKKELAKYKKYLRNIQDGDLPDLINQKSRNLLEPSGEFFGGREGSNFDVTEAASEEMKASNLKVKNPVEWAASSSKNPVTRWVARTELSPEFQGELDILEAGGYNRSSTKAEHIALNKILKEQVKARGGMKVPPLHEPDFLMLNHAQAPSGIQRLRGFLNP